MSQAQRSLPQGRIHLSRYWARVDLGQITSVLDRLWAKVDIRGADECWPFMGAKARGYGRIGLGGKEAGSVYAHRIIAETYLGPPAVDQPQIRHLCGVRSCCNPAHLAWGDQKANEADKRLHGTDNRGERHGMARLTREQVREIRAALERGASFRTVGSQFGVSWQTIQSIAHRETWAWLEDESEVMPI